MRGAAAAGGAVRANGAVVSGHSAWLQRTRASKQYSVNPNGWLKRRRGIAVAAARRHDRGLARRLPEVLVPDCLLPADSGGPAVPIDAVAESRPCRPCIDPWRARRCVGSAPPASPPRAGEVALVPDGEGGIGRGPLRPRRWRRRAVACRRQAARRACPPAPTGSPPASPIRRWPASPWRSAPIASRRYRNDTRRRRAASSCRPASMAPTSRASPTASMLARDLVNTPPTTSARPSLPKPRAISPPSHGAVVHRDRRRGAARSTASR